MTRAVERHAEPGPERAVELVRAGPSRLRTALTALLVLSTAPSARAEPPRPLLLRPEPAKGATATLCAVGDVMFGRHVAPVLRSRGADAALAPVRGLLRCDLTVGNLESIFTARPVSRRGPYRFTADPALAPALRRAGLRAMTLANNHALDAGPGGLSDSAAALEAAGIAALGVLTSSVAPEPRVVRAGALRVALFALDEVADPEDSDTDGWPRPVRSPSAVARALREARAAGVADVYVVLAHWGREYEPAPSAALREHARALVAAGADVVVGSHPHVLGPLATITAGDRTGLVAWSLGNFTFDQGAKPETSRSAVLRVELDARGFVRASAAPVELRRGLPVPAAPGGEVARAVEADLGAPSFAAVEARALEATRVLGRWRWDGAARRGVEAPGAGTARSTGATATGGDAGSTRLAGAPPVDARALARRTTELTVDLRGDGRPLLVTLADGLVEVHETAAATSRVVWRNERASWRVLRVTAGDADHDGRKELLLLRVLVGEDGRATTHPFLMGWRGGRYRITWGGSATHRLIQDAQLTDLDGDGRDELLVLDGGTIAGDEGDALSIWTWHGWGFQEEWRTRAPSPARSLGVDTKSRAAVLLGR